MERDDIRRLSKDELIDLVLRLQRPAKTPRTSAKPPSLSWKEQFENARPGGAKPGHEGKAPNGYLSRRAADGEADVRTIVETAGLKNLKNPFRTIPA